MAKRRPFFFSFGSLFSIFAPILTNRACRTNRIGGKKASYFFSVVHRKFESKYLISKINPLFIAIFTRIVLHRLVWTRDLVAATACQSSSVRFSAIFRALRLLSASVSPAPADSFDCQVLGQFGSCERARFVLLRPSKVIDLCSATKLRAARRQSGAFRGDFSSNSH